MNEPFEKYYVDRPDMFIRSNEHRCRSMSIKEYAILSNYENWDAFYSNKVNQLNLVNESGNFNVGSLELFGFNHDQFFKDNGFMTIDSVSFSGGGYYTVVKCGQ